MHMKLYGIFTYEKLSFSIHIFTLFISNIKKNSHNQVLVLLMLYTEVK